MKTLVLVSVMTLSTLFGGDRAVAEIPPGAKQVTFVVH